MPNDRQAKPETRYKPELLREGKGWCKVCDQVLPIDRFYEATAHMIGYHVCKNCCPMLVPRMKAKRSIPKWQRVENLRYQRKVQLTQLAGGSCQRCGYDEFISGLCFHHIEEREFKLSMLQKVSFERAIAEIDKCVLLCMSCHTAYHGNDWNARFVKRQSIGWAIEQYVLPAIRFR